MVVGVGVDRRVVLAHIRRRLAGLADARGESDRHRNIVVVREVVGGPIVSQQCGVYLKIGPIAKPSAGSGTRRPRSRPPPGEPGHETPARDRLALERAGDLAVERVLGLLLCACRAPARTISRRDSGGAARTSGPAALARIASSASGAPARTSALAARGPRSRPSRPRGRRRPRPPRRAPASPAPWASALSVITSASSATASMSPSATSRSSPSAYRRSPASSRGRRRAGAARAGCRSAADSPRRSPRPAARILAAPSARGPAAASCAGPPAALDGRRRRRQRVARGSPSARPRSCSSARSRSSAARRLGRPDRPARLGATGRSWELREGGRGGRERALECSGV